MLWLLIEAEFLAIVLVLVYVGAVMVLFLFVVMMLDINLEELRSGFTRYAWFGWITAAVVVLEVAGVVLTKRLGIDVTRGAAPLPAGTCSIPCDRRPGHCGAERSTPSCLRRSTSRP